MSHDWSALAARLKTASGPDPAIDVVIAEAFGMPMAAYSESAADCRRLVARVLPDWRLHLGFDGAGGRPYAVVSNADIRVEAEAPTVPLAILTALMELASLKTD